MWLSLLPNPSQREEDFFFPSGRCPEERWEIFKLILKTKAP